MKIFISIALVVVAVILAIYTLIVGGVAKDEKRQEGCISTITSVAFFPLLISTIIQIIAIVFWFVKFI